MIPQIFLSYAREDEEQVRELYRKLSEAGFKPWMDVEDLLGGERWRARIEKAIRESNFFVVCLSDNSVNKEGFLQREIRTALDVWQEKRDSDIYLIPVRLEECDVPDTELREFHWVDWFRPNGCERLVKSIEVGMERTAPKTTKKAPVVVSDTPKLDLTPGGIVKAAPDTLKDLLAMPDPPQRIWWERAEMEFCLVPAGEFVMGISEEEARKWHKEFGGELEWYMRSTPQRQVYLDAYYTGRYPVTNRQYARFVQDTDHRAPFRTDDWAKPYNWDKARRTPPPGKEDHPAVLVSWDDAQAYCEWAGLRLLTEAEWEKAASWDAKAGRKRMYPWGDGWDARKCNSAERLAGRELRTYEEWDKWWKDWLKLDPVKRNEDTTTPVGAYSPKGDSPYGCADMAGNVWEWAADRYDAGYYKVSPNRNPKGPDSGDYRVVRGGSWFDFRYGARSASRIRINPDYLFLNRGFRCGLAFTFSL